MFLTCPICGIKHHKENTLRIQRESKKGLCPHCYKYKNKKSLILCKKTQEKYF